MKIRKWTVAVVVALLCVMLIEVASAATIASGTCGADGDNLKWVLSSDGVLTISGTGKMKNYGWWDETPWFDHFDSVTGVIIEKGVTTIGDYAFMALNISKVNIPSGVTYIGNGAFWECNKLTSVSIPDTVKSINNHAFASCDLKTLSLPEGLLSLGMYAFEDNDRLVSVTIPASVSSLALPVFSGCDSMTEILVASGSKSRTSVDGVLFAKDMEYLIEFPSGKTGAYSLPEGVVELLHRSFYQSKVTSITLPASLEQCDDCAFWEAGSLVEIKVASGSKNFSAVDGVLYNVDKTTLIAFPPAKQMAYTILSGVTAIRSRAFYNGKIQSVTIPGTVKSIGQEAFAECYDLTSVTIPKSVTSIGDGAFYDCYRVTIVGERGSVAETYANDNQITFVALDDVKPEPTAAVPTTPTVPPTETPASAADKLASPKLSSVTNAATGVTIKWGKVTGAENYRVYYKTTGGWKKLTDTAKTSYTWTKAQSGMKYTFTVRCVTADGKTTTSSYDKTGKSITYLATPKLSSVTNAATGVTIKWGKVTGAAKYRVYYKTTGGWKKLVDTKSTSYTWTKAKSGTKYTFTVRSLSSTGKTVSAYDTTGKSITYLATPKVSSVKGSSKGITIKWGKVTGAAKYRVFYKTTGGWKKLVDTKSTSYTWKKAKSGTKYTFTVRSLSSTGKTTSAYDTKGVSIKYAK